MKIVMGIYFISVMVIQTICASTWAYRDDHQRVLGLVIGFFWGLMFVFLNVLVLGLTAIFLFRLDGIQ